MSVILYHNPRCSKSRQTKELLDEQGVEYEVIEYLKTPPDAQTLKEILQLLGLRAEQLLRKHESEFQQAGLDRDDVTEQQIIEAMIRFPKLIERPIVVSNGKAAIGRPPTQVLDVL